MVDEPPMSRLVKAVAVKGLLADLRAGLDDLRMRSTRGERVDLKQEADVFIAKIDAIQKAVNAPCVKPE